MFLNTKLRRLLLLAALITLFTLNNYASPTFAAIVLDQNFAQAIDSNSPVFVSSSNPNATITANVADATASDGKVARFTLPAGSAPGPGNGPNLQSKQRYQYGTYEARLKASACTQSEGIITGLFTYYNDGSDTNGNGLPDNSEIDFEWLCAEPQTIWLTMWTDYNGATEASRRVYRVINLATGTIKYTRYSENFSTFTDISGSATENQPTSVPAIPGYNSATAYYDYGFTWTSTSVTWYIKHPTTGAKIILWDYRGPSARITKVPAYFMVNTWHSNNWTPECCSGATGSPTVNRNIFLDWIRFSTLDTNPTPIPSATPSSSNGTPYTGTSAAIPGRIQAENYNNGGQGIAYSDNEAANQGGQFRTTEGVDIEATTDTGAGSNVGWTAAGEWLKYTVNVQTTSTYTINFRVASAQAGGTLHLEVDGVNVTGAMTVPNTGGWQVWTTVSRTGVNLTAGQHVLRLVTDAAGGNYNWIEFVGGTGATATRTSTRTPTRAPQLPTNTPGGATATRTPTRTATRTPTTSMGVSAWQPNTAYSTGQPVTYNGVTYRCLQPHTSLVGWEPPNVPALWARQ